MGHVQRRVLALSDWNGAWVAVGDTNGAQVAVADLRGDGHGVYAAVSATGTADRVALADPITGVILGSTTLTVGGVNGLGTARG